MFNLLKSIRFLNFVYWLYKFNKLIVKQSTSISEGYVPSIGHKF